MNALKQKSVTVDYDKEEVGNCLTDILVENKVILELKAANSFTIILDYELQLTNYLKVTNYELGLLLLFGINQL